MLAYLALCALLAVAAWTDLLALRIPNWVNVALVAVFVLHALLQPAPVAWIAHLGAGALVLLVGIGLYATGCVGAGDIKLLAATALWLGLPLLPAHLALSTLTALVLVVVLMALRAFAPASAARWGWRLPPPLLPGQPVPCGIAVAASAALLARPPEIALWLS